MPRIVISVRPESESTFSSQVAKGLQAKFGKKRVTILQQIPDQQIRLAAIAQAQIIIVIVDAMWQP